MSEVELKLESPLLVGGKRLKSNVLQSLDYIPGHVLRAAFAKYILLNCPLYLPGDQDEKGRYNYVGLKDESKCRSCEFYNTCKNFSDIGFSFFYPADYDILPFTARTCKNRPDEHGIRDSLTHRGGAKCGKCMENGNLQGYERDRLGRMEAARGYVSHGKIASVPRVSFDRTAIDPYTRTALEGSLYSVDAVRQGITFKGKIKGLENSDIKEGWILHVGRYSSVGLGRMKLQSIGPDGGDKNLLELLQEFNLKMERRSGMPGEKYIPVMLRSDAKLGFEQKEKFKMPMSTGDYKGEWKTLLFGDEEDFKVEQVYGEYDIYRGYDTSREWNKWEKDPEIYTLKGTTILLTTQRPLELIIPRLRKLEERGIGKDTLNGFGEVEICSRLHVKGEM